MKRIKGMVCSNIFSILGTSFQIISNIDTLVEQYNLIFSKYINTNEFNFTKVYMLKKKGIYNLKIEGICSEKFIYQYQMIEALKYKVFYDNLWSKDNPPILFHGGMIEHNGNAVLICGEAGSGKTTWVLEMLGHHYHYMAEEIAILNISDKKCVVNPFPIALRSSSYPKNVHSVKLNRFMFEKCGKEKLQLWTAPIENDYKNLQANLAGIIVLKRDPNNTYFIKDNNISDIIKKFSYTRGNIVESAKNKENLIDLLKTINVTSLFSCDYDATKKILLTLLEECTEKRCKV